MFCRSKRPTVFVFVLFYFLLFEQNVILSIFRFSITFSLKFAFLSLAHSTKFRARPGLTGWVQFLIILCVSSFYEIFVLMFVLTTSPPYMYYNLYHHDACLWIVRTMFGSMLYLHWLCLWSSCVQIMCWHCVLCTIR